MTDEQIRQELISWGANTDAPAWSSHLLDNFFRRVMQSDDAEVNDVVQPLYSLIGEAALTQTMGYLIRDVTVLAFWKYRESYESSDFSWLGDAIESDCTQTQVYLAMNWMPPAMLRPSHILRILKSLAGTSYWSEAVANLEDDAANKEVQALIKDWLGEGVDVSLHADLSRLANLGVGSIDSDVKDGTLKDNGTF